MNSSFITFLFRKYPNNTPTANPERWAICPILDPGNNNKRVSSSRKKKIPAVLIVIGTNHTRTIIYGFKMVAIPQRAKANPEDPIPSCLGYIRPKARFAITTDVTKRSK